MNVYLHELKISKKFVIIWLLVKLTLASIMIFMYLSIRDEIDLFTQLLDNFPESLKLAYGINIDTFGSTMGYYSSFVLTFILLCSSIEGMIFGMSILSKEIIERTSDFLYSKPISRIKIITSKLFAAKTLIIISNILFIIGIYICLSIVSTTNIDMKTFILIALIPLLLQIIFFSIGIVISSIFIKIKAITTISMGLIFGLYMFSTFGDKDLRILMPFKYFDSSYILINKEYEIKYVITTLIIAIISIALTYLINNKKDIPSV